MQALLAVIDQRRRRRSRVLVGLGLTAAMAVAGGVGVALGTELVPDRLDPSAPTVSAAIAAPMPVQTLTLAVLPVDDQTSAALAAGARDALAHLVARELSVIPRATVIDYFALSRIVEPQPVRGTQRPSRSRWIDAARALGATTIVDGRLEDAGPGVRVILEARDPDGAVLHRSEQATTPDALGDAMRSAAARIAEAFGAPALEIPVRHDHQWDYDRRLAEGRSHLERGHFEPATSALQAAIALRPEASEARFHLVLARSWVGQTDEALAEIERTLATTPPPRERAFLLAYEAHVAGRHADAIARFRAAAAAHPGDRYIDYGLFESLFHGGYPSEGIAVYRQRLGAVSPLVSIALMHALDHYAAHGDREGLQWALELAPSVDRGFAGVWAVRLALFDRDYDEALEAVARLDGSHDPAVSDALSIELHALAGRSWLARTLAEQLEARDPRLALLPLLALHTHLGSPQREGYRVRALAQATEAPRPLDRIHALTAIALLELPTADHRLAELRDALHRAAEGLGQPEARTATILALLAGAPYDATEIEAAQASELPQAQAIAYAYAAEHEGDLQAALAQWDRALEAEMDGRFVAVLAWNKARVAALAGRDEVVRATCAAIVRPRSFHWSWAAVTAVEPCGVTRQRSHEAFETPTRRAPP
jgi:tetratricopeptide (TPR) repeat protein